MTDPANEGTLPAEQPQVTANTAFKRRGFKPAAEVIAEAEAAGQSTAEQPPVTPAAQESDPDMNSIIMADENITFETPEGVAPFTPPQAAEAPEAATPTEPKIRIGTREFTNQEEAFAYAEQLEQERLVADAFRHGVETASSAIPGNPQPAPAAPEVTQEIDPLYYTDPQAYFRKRETEIVEKAKAAVQQDLQKKQSHDQVWTQFYNDYPDLSADKDLVEMFLQRDWGALQHIETKQALAKLAGTVRARLKTSVESRMPKVALPRVGATASPGGGQQVTQPSQPSKPLNFTQQMNKLKKGRVTFR